MTQVGASTLWGDWVLGDLVDAARVVSDILGPAAQVAWVRIASPDGRHGADAPVTITVLTRSESEHSRLRQAAISGEFTPDHVFEPTDTHWSALVGGIYLVLMVDEAS